MRVQRVVGHGVVAVGKEEGKPTSNIVSLVGSGVVFVCLFRLYAD